MSAFGIYGIRNTFLNGYERLNVRAQSNFYTPLKFYGFKFNFQASIQTSQLAYRNEDLFGNRLYAGFGLACDEADDRAADRALTALEVDGAGLDAMDRRYLNVIAVNYGGGPVGVETIAAALSEPRDAIEEIIEPFLIQQGLVQRTPRGRLLTGHAFRHLGLAEPARDPAQFGLFGQDEDA